VGGERLAARVVTAWRHGNVRLQESDGIQLTLVTVLD
jgi:hypothetical protein